MHGEGSARSNVDPATCAFSTTWTVDVDAEFGTKEFEGKADKGWVAEDGAGNKFLAPKDESGKNETFAKGLGDELGKAWQELGAQGETDDVSEILETFKAKAGAYTPKYEEMQLTFENAKVTSDEVQDRLQGVIQISPNQTKIPVDEAWLYEDKAFDEQFPHAARAYFNEHTRGPWTTALNNELEKAGVGAVSIGGDAMLAACCQDDFVKDVREWFKPKRTETSKKRPWVERIDEHLRKNRSAFFEPMLNDVQNRVQGLLAGDQHKELVATVRIDLEDASVLIGDQAAGVTPELKAAIGTDVVAFLVAMGAGSAGDIAFTSFENDLNPLGFGYRDGDGKLANSAYIKQKFREADPGKHEWIPCNRIFQVVARDMDSRATDEALEAVDIAERWMGWVNLQHQLRTPTQHVVFKPSSEHPDLMKSLATYMRDKKGTVADFAGGLRASHFGLSGHTGALYLPPAPGEKAKAQTKGQPAFHDLLREAFDGNDKPTEYIEALKKVVEDTLWDGEMDFLPMELRAHADAVGVDYEGKADVQLGGTLLKLGQDINGYYIELDRTLNSVKVPRA